MQKYDVSDLTTPRGIARALLAFYREDGSNWTTRRFARGADGFEVLPTSPDATCFCMWGALYRLTASQPAEDDTRVDGLPLPVANAAYELGRILGAKETPFAVFALAAVNDSRRTYADLRVLLEKVAEGEP